MKKKATEKQPEKRGRTLTLAMSLENAAFFTPDGEFVPADEIRHILLSFAERAAVMQNERHVVGDYPLRDSNGNKVGEATIEG
jgi:hypothetical protein